MIGPILLIKHTTPPDILPISLHDALPICQPSKNSFLGPHHSGRSDAHLLREALGGRFSSQAWTQFRTKSRSEEHTSELQSRQYIVCRLLLEKKKYVNGTKFIT